jgi:hypothetical protein
MMEEWNDGRMKQKEYWKTGIVEEWKDGTKGKDGVMEN